MPVAPPDVPLTVSYYKQRKEKNLCTRCGIKNKTEYIKCEKCRDKERIYMKEKRQKDPLFRQRQYDKRSSIMWKQHKQAIKIMGGVCVNCNENNILVLQINHLNGGGIQEYNYGKTHRSVYRDIIDGKRNISDLDIRCSNCNILYEYERGARTNWFEKGDI